MQTKNEALMSALKDPLLAKKKKVIEGLNALLEADLSNPSNFRKAVITQGNLLNGLGSFKFKKEQHQDNGNFLMRNGSNVEGGSKDLNYNFDALYRQAAINRVLFTLKDATNAQLEAIINQDIMNSSNQAALRQKLFNDTASPGQAKSQFGQPELVIPSWDSDQDNILNKDALEEIQSRARSVLLARKIEEYNSADAKTKLDNLLQANGLPNLKSATREIFSLQPGPPPVSVVDSMILEDFNPKSLPFADTPIAIAAKKALSLHIKGLSDEEVLGHGLITLNEQDPAKFRKQFEREVSAQHLVDEDINEIKGLLGARFIPLRVGQLKLTKRNLVTTEESACFDMRAMKADLKLEEHFAGEEEQDKYIDYALTTDSLPKIRQAFATQAIRLKIMLAGDKIEEALDPLIKVTDVAGLKQVLENQPSLGFKNKPKFQEALSDSTDLAAIIASAHIRKNLSFSNRSGDLKELIGLTGKPFIDKYHEKFSGGMDNSIKDKITEYFSVDLTHINQARRQALAAYVKAELPKLPDKELSTLIAPPGSRGDIVNATQVLFSSDPAMANPAEDLIVEYPRDEGINLELRNYAAVEQISRWEKERLNLSGPFYDQLIQGINTLTIISNNDTKFSGTIQSLVSNSKFPDKEKKRVQACFAESLFRKYPENKIGPIPKPPALDKLTELTKETDIEKFKQLLITKFAVTDTSWLSKQTMEQVQKSACMRNIELRKDRPIRFVEKRPQLFELIGNLPLEEQRVLADKPEVLIALAAAQDKTEIERVLGGKNRVDDRLIDKAVKENNSLNAISKIANYKIAEILAQVNPPVTVTLEHVKEINIELLARALSFSNDKEYVAAIQAIVNIIDPNNKNIYRQFGLLDDGTGVNSALNFDAIRTSINEEDEDPNNTNLIGIYPNRTPEEKAIILGLLALKKNNNIGLSQTEVNELLQNITTSKTGAEFIKLASTKSYRHGFAPSLDKQLTPQIYEAIKAESRKQSLLSPDHYQKALNKQAKELEALERPFWKMMGQSEQQERLERLINMNPIYWFNPAFRAYAKQNALAVKKELQDLSKYCDNSIIYLKNKIKAVEAQKASLPSEAEIDALTVTSEQKEAMKKEVAERVKKLETLIGEMNKELGRFESMELVLKGKNADGKQHATMPVGGLLQMLDDAQAGKKDIEFIDPHHYSHDYKVETKPDHMKPTWLGDPRDPNKASDQVQTSLAIERVPADRFRAIDAIPEGSYREHTIEITVPAQGGGPATNAKGLFIEENFKERDLQVTRGGDVQSSLKLTVLRFPGTTEGNVCLAMSVAALLFANYNGPPEKVVLTNETPEKGLLLWTAVMAIIKNDPTIKISEKDFEIRGPAFHPESQTGFMGRWDKKSFYKLYFETNPEVKNMLDRVKEVNKKKFGKEGKEALKQVAKDTAELTKVHRNHLSNIIEKDNKEEKKGSGATLGGGGR